MSGDPFLLAIVRKMRLAREIRFTTIPFQTSEFKLFENKVVEECFFNVLQFLSAESAYSSKGILFDDTSEVRKNLSAIVPN